MTLRRYPRSFKYLLAILVVSFAVALLTVMYASYFSPFEEVAKAYETQLWGEVIHPPL